MSDQRWSFFRAGGVDQVVLSSGADLVAVSKLDKKLWVALACPTKGTELDERSLELFDSDKDGRIRPPEVLEAISWSSSVFKSLDFFFEKGSSVPLGALSDSDEGKAVAASASRILKDLGKKDAKAISLEDVTAMQEAFASTRFNGDGIVPAESSEDDEAVKSVIVNIIENEGTVTDRSGKPGIDLALTESFFKGAKEMVAWADEGVGALSPLGDKTPAALEALAAIEAKAEDFFTRCRIATFDARGTALLGTSEADLTSLATKSLERTHEDLAKLPLAKVDPNGQLPLELGLNPAWAARVAAFREAAIKPILGDKRSITEADLNEIRAKLDGFRGWQGRKPAPKAGQLPLERLREILAGNAEKTILELIEKDKSLEAEYAKITQVERAIRLRKDLVELLRNFINFADFYGKRQGVFQAGTLFLDGRSCDLCIRVNDPGKHAALASLSKAYLVYCDLTRVPKAGDPAEKMTIVAAFTAGDVDNIMVGRNGVFYDRKGQDWDATITSIVENPISIGQAFWTPYKRLIRLVEDAIAKRAADKEKASTAAVDGAAASAASADKAAPPPAPGAPPAAPEPKKGFDVGTLAAIGIAVGSIGTFLGVIFTSFLGLGLWMPFGILGLLLLISGPSMFIAWLKLRQRNLGPILDANGWAVNAMVRINVPFGGSMTQVRTLPEGASRSADDPYADKKTPWGLYAVLLILIGGAVLWSLGKLDGFLPEKAKSTTVFAPAASAAPSAAPAAPPAPAPSAAPAAAPAK